MKYVTKEEKEKLFVEAKKKAYNNEELTEEEQDVVFEYLEAQERRMSRYLDGGPAPPIDLLLKLTKYYKLTNALEDMEEIEKTRTTKFEIDYTKWIENYSEINQTDS